MPKLLASGVPLVLGLTRPRPTPRPSMLSSICTATTRMTPAMMAAQEMRV